MEVKLAKLIEKEIEARLMIDAKNAEVVELKRMNALLEIENRDKKESKVGESEVRLERIVPNNE